jgi:hypothetical protein
LWFLKYFLKTLFQLLFHCFSSLFWKLQKALPGFFICIFSSLTCLKKPVFSKQAAVKGTSQDILGSSDHHKVLASRSLFLKSEKMPALLYEGKGPEYRPFRDFRHVPPALGIDLKSWKGPSPILNSVMSKTLQFYLWIFSKLSNFF